MYENISKQSTLSAAIATALFGSMLSSTTQAALSSPNTLQFTLGTPAVVACNYGTTPPCAKAGYNITDVVGSYFSMDTNSNGVEPGEKTPIESFVGLTVGATQDATGSHSGPVNGSEVNNIDEPWTFFGGTGMHKTATPFTVTAGMGTDDYTADLTGWRVAWNGADSILMTQLGTPTITCATGSSCTATSAYTLDAAFHVNGAGFTSVAYTLHLEGTIAATPPAPPATGAVACDLGAPNHPAACGSDGTCNAPEALALTGGDDDASFNPVGGTVFAFGCTGIAVGQAEDVFLTLPSALPTRTDRLVYRKYIGGAWTTYATSTDDGSRIMTGDSATSMGNCDATTAWVAGINPAHDCAKITITDGDPAGDSDPAAGAIADPGSISAPTAANLVSSTSGCSINHDPTSPLQGGAWGVLAAFAGLLVMRRRKRGQ